MSAVLELARELVGRPSVTPEDAGCQRLIAERLLAAGFEAEWFFCGEVSNVLLTRGTARPALWFLGHTDVVPPGPEDEWVSPPFEPQVRDAVLYGRGAADMKGAVAAMVVALEAFVEDAPDHRGQVGMLLTSDEEGLAVDGIARVAEVLATRGSAPEYCLVGEPSSCGRLGDTVRIGRRGAINARLAVRGIQGHTAFPETIDNPVHRLAPLLAELAATDWDAGNGDFPPTHCQVSNIRAGTGAENVTPGRVELWFNFRTSPLSGAEELEARVRALVERHAITDYALEWRVMGRPFRSEPGPLRAAVTQAVQEVLAVDPELNTGGGTSDGRFIAPLGSEVLELGLVNQSIHKVDEHAPVADLEALANTYLRVLEQLFRV
ncbi:MAG: succinyl-diaminopimelate desuccinylase [Xanthomonadales bacterium]|nr:succinyl-diaminopimelate desuccinylase [Xanthomonadales bacterium]NIN59529.1 succinyl-diaminopimelate desuccinylase [Xanthomonadales bacterium]NIN74895.1 succinyl-diaminopimelate desuccinylase [Xanthomonadales bacterium]NIO14037.1 succinyl-diaminopimelate desuccinylase [Xanthomonadales bacterium]NIP11922.1 succinyl-diaminopimelate desuccinylase [Xanthomonadales bacterium]